MKAVLSQLPSCCCCEVFLLYRRKISHIIYERQCRNTHTKTKAQSDNATIKLEIFIIVTSVLNSQVRSFLRFQFRLTFFILMLLGTRKKKQLDYFIKKLLCFSFKEKSTGCTLSWQKFSFEISSVFIQRKKLLEHI